jgi:hypothetical protein
LFKCLARWAIPCKIEKEAFLNLFISYISNGADIVDFFSQIDDTNVVFSIPIMISILVFFSLSSLQFSFGLVSKVKRNENETNNNNNGILKRLQLLIFGTEIWALLLVLMFQDLPFFLMRIIVIVYYQQLSKNYTLYFFAIKTLIMSIVEIYMIGEIIVNDLRKRK